MTAMAALKPLVGRWSTTITMLSPPKEAGKTYRAIDTYRWMPGEQVLVHEVEARMGKAAIHSMEIYTAKGGKIVSRNFDAGGTVSDYKAEMADGTWKVVGSTERFTSTSITRNAIEGVWEMKGKKGWEDWMTVRLDRVT